MTKKKILYNLYSLQICRLDYGMFMIQRVEALIKDIILAKVAQENMQNFHRKLVVELYQWGTNKQQNGMESYLEKHVMCRNY